MVLDSTSKIDHFLFAFTLCVVSVFVFSYVHVHHFFLFGLVCFLLLVGALYCHGPFPGCYGWRYLVLMYHPLILHIWRSPDGFSYFACGNSNGYITGLGGRTGVRNYIFRSIVVTRASFNIQTAWSGAYTGSWFFGQFGVEYLQLLVRCS